MKRDQKIFKFLLITAGLVFTFSCNKKDEIPDINFNKAINYGSMTDREGNTYKTVTIGTQTWMAENLKTTTFNNGTQISLVTDKNIWKNLNQPGYCWFNNDATKYKSKYGALYNWYALNSGNLCPTGWHVPSDAEWEILKTYLGGEGVAGGKLKETGTSHWNSPNTGANNESGFTALPAGMRSYYGGSFMFVGHEGHWWCSTVYSEDFPYSQTISYDNKSVILSHLDSSYKSGFSVRCVKD